MCSPGSACFSWQVLARNSSVGFVDAGEGVEGGEVCRIGMGIPTPREGRRRRAVEDRVRSNLVLHFVVGGHGDVVGLQPGEDAEHVAGTGGVVEHAEADRVATLQPCG